MHITTAAGRQISHSEVGELSILANLSERDGIRIGTVKRTHWLRCSLCFVQQIFNSIKERVEKKVQVGGFVDMMFRLPRTHEFF